jgi:hypothetical protein
MLGRFSASLGLLRPRALARTQKSVDKLLGDTQETRRTLKQLAAGQAQLQAASEDVLARLDAMANEMRTLQQQVAMLTFRESQLRAVMRADAAMEYALGRLPAACDEKRIAAHLRAIIERAELHLQPFPYILVPDVFPADFYDALLQGIPPVELFGDKPFNKQQLKVPFVMAPAYSREVWNFFVFRVAPKLLQPLLLEKFRAPLADWIASNWPALAGNPFGPPMEFNTADGRIMLRGRGYRIRPHRDPKWGFLTCLLYLARDNDSESWGTQLYFVDEDAPAKGAAPHWIDPDSCRLAREVPFQRNSMLVFLNSTGAHGAFIPDDAEPADLQRYLYQCRIGPTPAATRTLMASLPAEQVALWAGKIADY